MTRTRREFVAGLGAVASLPLLLAACGDDEKPTSTSSTGGAPAGPWTFTDGRGKEVSLDKLPERIVMHEYAAIALWDYGIRPVGIYASVPLKEQPLLAELDLTGIESVGEAWGEVNLEALAALQPDLVITTWWPSQKMLGGVKDAKLEAKMAAISPLLGIDAQVPAQQTIEQFDALAAKLGADTKGAEIVAQKERYDAAVTKIKDVAKEKADIRVLAISTTPEAFYVGKVEDYAELREFEAWGVNVVSGKSKDAYWDTLSWEDADKYAADLIMYDARANATTPDELAKMPVWPDLPAVKADQLAPWHMEEAVSYRHFATHVEELAAALEQAKRVA